MILDGYIRVSQVGGRRGDGFISPSVQREQIEAWTSSSGALLGEVFEELDESGGRPDRPLLMEAIERVECGESDGMVVAKLDRFGRSLLDGLGAIARIEAVGGTFVSVQDGFDLGTATGKLVLRIMFSIGEWELERARINWDTARGRAVERGLYIARRAPPGYRRGKDRRLRIEPKEASVIRELFERRLRGESCERMAGFLNDSEVQTESGVPWCEFNVRLLIKTRAYRGEVRNGRHSNRDAHEPIIDDGTWEACQWPPIAAGKQIHTLLGGRLRCAACGRMMRPTRETLRSRFSYYRCYGVGGKCPAPAHMRVDHLDPLVEEFIFGLCRQASGRGSKSGAERSEEELARAEEMLSEYRDNPRLHRRLGSESFEAGVAIRQRSVERKLLEVNRARRTVRQPKFEIGNLESRWPGLSWDERRAAVGELIDCVVIARGKEPVTERAWIFKRGHGPRTHDERGKRVEHFDPSFKDASKPPPVRRWPEERIEKRLRAFLGTRSEWPSYAEFADAGYGRLNTQVMAWGGPIYWGHKLGVTVQLAVQWNDRLLRDALRPLLQGREDWPETAEFHAKGMASLRRVIARRGGMDRWAKKMGFKYCKAKVTWSDGEIERQLRQFVGEGEVFPAWREFEGAGQRALYRSVLDRGGITHWCKRIGVRRTARSRAAGRAAQTRARNRRRQKA
ncbi:MAG: recombinase family protein [Solirubrobacterales bacterium]